MSDTSTCNGLKRKNTNDDTDYNNIVEKKAKAISSTKISSTKTTSILSSIFSVIRTHKSPTGSSSIKIIKELNGQFDGKRVKAAIKKAVASGVLICITKASFAVAGDPVYEDESEKVTIVDTVLGAGDRVVVRGDSVIIQYVGTLETGHEFDRGSKFSFQVGAGDVVKGMDIGVLGMKLNGKRKITVPPSLGYGKRGSSPDIPPSVSLIFEITLKSITASIPL